MIKIDKTKQWEQLCSKKNNWNTVVAATTGAGKSFVLAPLVLARIMDAEAKMLEPIQHINEEG